MRVLRRLRRVLLWTTTSGVLLSAAILLGKSAGQSRLIPEPAATPTALAQTRALATPPPSPAPTITPIPATPAPATATAAPTPEPPPPPPPPPPPAVSTDAPQPTAPRQPAGEDSQLAQQLIALVNSRRGQQHLPSLAQSDPLMAAAQQYAGLHFALSPDALNHNLDGGPGDRASRQGYMGRIGEVLAESPVSAQEILDVWMGSPAHYAILMDPHYTDIGMGCHKGPSPDRTYELALCVGMLGYR